MESRALVCLVCGRALGAGEAPAFLTLVAGEPRALCADCTARPAARRALAALLGVGEGALASFLASPAHHGAPDEDPPGLPADRQADAPW